MAYDHNQRQMLIAAAASTESLAVIGHFCPAFWPITLKKAALIFTTAAGAAGNCAIKKYPVAGSSSNAVTIDNIVFDGTIGAQGKVVYVDSLDYEIKPGEELIFEIDDVAASGVADIVIGFEERWEVPGNLTAMTLSA